MMVSRASSNLFLIFEGRTYTYAQFFALIGQVGNWLIKELGIKKHEIVAVDGGNTPEYIMLWLGLESIGAAPAFINCNLTKDPLIHSVKLCESRYLISDTDVRGLVEPCREKLEANVEDVRGEQRKAALRRVEMELDEAEEMVRVFPF